MNKQVKCGNGPKILLFNQLLYTLVILKQKIDYRTKFFPKNYVPQSIFIIGAVFFKK